MTASSEFKELENLKNVLRKAAENTKTLYIKLRIEDCLEDLEELQESAAQRELEFDNVDLNPDGE